jgi:hypothetical protein
VADARGGIATRPPQITQHLVMGSARRRPQGRRPRGNLLKSMIDLLNLAFPYFSLIFVGFACGKFKQIPESGLEWINFFLLYVALPALFFHNPCENARSNNSTIRRS